MTKELSELFDELLFDDFEFVIKRNNRIWNVSYEQTDYVYNRPKDLFGKVIKWTGDDSIIIRYENGSTAEINVAHYLRKRTIIFMYPRGNVSHDYLKVERGVEYLIHFTPLENLPRIMKYGICPRSELKGNGRFTDDMRLDNNADATSFSVSFPNYKMFYDKRKRTMKDTLFAVLLVDIDALLSVEKGDIAYHAHNASHTSMRQTDFFAKARIDSAAGMFEDTPDKVREQYDLPDNYPTDPQAEIQIRGVISKEFIREIHVDSDEAYAAIYNMGIWDLPLVRLDDTYFWPRKDHKYWEKAK